VLVLAASLLACARSESAPGGEGTTAAVATPAPALAPGAAPTPVPTPASDPDRLPGSEALDVNDPRVRVAAESVNDLFLGRSAAVSARLEPDLRAQLSPAVLDGLVAGVVEAHGAPARVMDAWAGELQEEGLVWPTASVLLRMSRSPVRFRLLLVFNRDETVRGLWLRPL
jgi:hypothetical protein